MKFTTEQLAVIENDQASFVVVAAAGSGKTSVLAERYLRLVQQGHSPDSILTITFTNKAAADMKRRIVNRLRRERLYDAAQIAETGPIQTFHAFCERILRENALLAGLDPQFDILSPSDASQLRRQCIRDVLATDLIDFPEAAELVRTAAGKREFQATTPYQQLEDTVIGVLERMHSSTFSDDYYEQKFGNLEAARASFVQIVQSEIDPDLELDLAEISIEDWFAAITSAYAAAKKRDRFRYVKPPWLKTKQAKDQTAFLRQTAGVIQLALDTSSRIRIKMMRSQQFDFSALEHLTIGLLKDRIEARTRLQRQYRYVMVDESQDMNPIQDELVSLLGVREVMQVGDPQQSIYGFRMADVERFQSKASNSNTLRLGFNFRSEPGIINFVNEFFRDQWPDNYSPMQKLGQAIEDPEDDPFAGPSLDFSGVEHWPIGTTNYALIATRIKELIQDGTAPGKITILVRGMKFAAMIQEAMERLGVPAAIVGGSTKFYARMEVRDLANILSALASPYDDFALLATLGGPAAQLSLDTLISLSAVTPVSERLPNIKLELPEDQVKLDAFRAWFEPLREGADRMSAAEVLAEVFRSSPLLVNVAKGPGGEQALANVRKLLMMASDQADLSPLDFAAQMRTISELKEQEGDAPVHEDDSVSESERPVQIMTIHKAKGLEFDTVILPDTGGKFEQDIRPVVFDQRLPFVSVKLGADDGLTHRLIHHRMSVRSIAEELRVLYVALTRAKRKLCIVTVNTSKNTDSAAQRLQRTFSRLGDKITTRGAVSPPDENSVPSDE
jgi:ATP-dependent exoDNAse (exonuclease V) beta subunit